MLKATTVLELFEALSPAEQEKCRAALTSAATVPASSPKTKKQPLRLRPEHATDALVRDMVIRDLGITFKNTNSQAVNVC
jgi:hypothetical protein